MLALSTTAMAAHGGGLVLASLTPSNIVPVDSKNGGPVFVTSKIPEVLLPGQETRFASSYVVRLCSGVPITSAGNRGGAIPPPTGGDGDGTVTRKFEFNGLHFTAYAPHGVNRFILYVHGGPGSHGEYFFRGIQEIDSYRQINYGWISYDQRGCGRSARKKDGSHITHDDNIGDLLQLVEHIKNNLELNLVAIMGHSYGAWLSYDALAARADLNVKLVMVGQSPSIHLPRDRSFLIDLTLLKLFQPDDYARIYPQLIGGTLPMWRHSKIVRQALHDAGMRRKFYWSNPDVMKWYAELQAKVDNADNDQTFVEVMRSLKPKYEDDNVVIDPKLRIKQELLWILGYHDFLMGGEIERDRGEYPIMRFWQSAHFPHFEEPERFCDELTKFLG